MQTVAKPSLSMSMRAIGIAIILLFLLGVAMLLGWSPSSSGQPVDGAIATEPSPTPALAKEAVVAKCAGCGVIEATRVVEVADDAIAAGAAIGGALGNQMGGDRGKSLLSLFGAMGGATAGNDRQRVPSDKRYESTIRFDNGATRVFSETSPPTWQAGDRVRVVDGAIRLHG